jgi:outer membrane protein OmpA-like peptidoglycan-associated protein
VLFIIVLIIAGCAPPSPTDDPLKNFTGRFDQILDDLDDQESIQQTPNLEEFLDEFNLQKTRITEKIPFDSGEYDLSDKGKFILQSLADEVITIKEEFLQQYPDKSVTITITVIGYTDQSGFKEGTALVNELLEGLEGEIPKDKTELRKLLNQRLSEKRARIVGDHLKQRILATEQEDSQIQIERQIEGRGEELPPDIPPQYPVNDPRRQICKIWVEFTAMP